jgi:hypothetical protein
MDPSPFPSQNDTDDADTVVFSEGTSKAQAKTNNDGDSAKTESTKSESPSSLFSEGTSKAQAKIDKGNDDSAKTKSTDSESPGTLSNYSRSSNFSRSSYRSDDTNSVYSVEDREPEERNSDDYQSESIHRFPYGHICFGCEQPLCGHHREVKSVKSMAEEHFSLDVRAAEHGYYDGVDHYHLNKVRRKRIYKFWRQHVSAKSLDNAPACIFLMAMKLFPGGPERDGILMKSASRKRSYEKAFMKNSGGR